MGCEDATTIGRFETKPVTNIILPNLGVVDEEPELFSGARNPTSTDLLPEPEEYRIGPGDVLDISIFELFATGVQYSERKQVSDTGRIQLPYIGQVMAAGRTEQELIEDIKGRLTPEILKRPTVSVVTVVSRQKIFYISGAVAAPGPYPLGKADFRISEAVVQAGGLSQNNADNAYVIRTRTVPGATVPPENLMAPPAAAPVFPAPVPEFIPPPVVPAPALPPAAPQITPSPAPVPPQVPAPPAVAPNHGIETPEQFFPENELRPGETAPSAPSKPTPEPGTVAPPTAAPPAPVTPPPPAPAPAPSAPPTPPSGENNDEMLESLRPMVTMAELEPTQDLPSSPAPAQEESTAQKSLKATQQDGRFELTPQAGADLYPPSAPAAPAPEMYSYLTPPSPSETAQSEIGLAGIGQEVIRINLKALRGGDLSQNIVVRPGDEIRVEFNATGLYHVMGQVARPGAYPLQGDRQTVKQVIAGSGPMTPMAWASRCEIIRRIGDNQEVTYRINLDKLFAGTAPDIYVKPNDIINVGSHPVSRWMAVIRQSFRATYGFGFVYDRNFADRDFGR